MGEAPLPYLPDSIFSGLNRGEKVECDESHAEDSLSKMGSVRAISRRRTSERAQHNKYRSRCDTAGRMRTQGRLRITAAFDSPMA